MVLYRIFPRALGKKIGKLLGTTKYGTLARNSTRVISIKSKNVIELHSSLRKLTDPFKDYNVSGKMVIFDRSFYKCRLHENIYFTSCCRNNDLCNYKWLSEGKAIQYFDCAEFKTDMELRKKVD